jgi:hypothetical protein
MIPLHSPHVRDAPVPLANNAFHLTIGMIGYFHAGSQPFPSQGRMTCYRLIAKPDELRSMMLQGITQLLIKTALKFKVSLDQVHFFQ